MSKRAYVTREKTVMMPARDLARLTKRGWVVATDYVLRKVHVAYEINTGDMSQRVIGLVSDPKHVKHVAERVNTSYVEKNTLVRVRDLMDTDAIRWRTGRSKSTVVGTWMKWDDWPPPVATFGGSKVWFWPDVLACLERHGLTVRKEVV